MTAIGRVNNRLEAVIRLRIRGGHGERDVNALVDTGYSGAILLPQHLVESLGLEYLSAGKAVLADGSSRRFLTYTAEIVWGDEWLGVPVSALGSEPLIGIGLLVGTELRAAFVPGGAVAVLPLERSE